MRLGYTGVKQVIVIGCLWHIVSVFPRWVGIVQTLPEYASLIQSIDLAIAGITIAAILYAAVAILHNAWIEYNKDKGAAAQD